MRPTDLPRLRRLESTTAVGARIVINGRPRVVGFRRVGFEGEARLAGRTFATPWAHWQPAR